MGHLVPPGKAGGAVVYAHDHAGRPDCRAVLNIYNQRSKDLLLCSLCMSINALCSILETKGDQLVKTPVYYVFRMYQGHQDAVLVHSFVEEDTVSFQGQELPCVSCSVSKKAKLCWRLW